MQRNLVPANAQAAVECESERPEGLISVKAIFEKSTHPAIESNYDDHSPMKKHAD
jgi:hypothetical protein